MTTNDLSNLSHGELICHAKKLENTIVQLRGCIENLQGHKPVKQLRPLDFSKVALKILYIGWDYSGLVRQEINKSTVAEKLFDSFFKCRMLESEITAGFGVCGRTDKGVSGLSQVVTLNLRSNVHSGCGVTVPENTSNLYPEKAECDYVLLGNKNLPPDIRILAWAPVPLEFSPRHDCKSRSYKYFFPAAQLNLDTMRVSASKLEGRHDFRNFCSSQVMNGVTNHERVILSISITEESSDKVGPRRMCCIDIRGTAFLYHQIRYIVSILLTIGRGFETPELIDALLDVQKTPGKPQYQMAEPEPLLFYEPEFENIEWQTSQAAQDDIVRHLQKIWTEYATKSIVAETMLRAVEDMFPGCKQNNYLAAISREAPAASSANRKPILKRTCEETLEQRISSREAKRAVREAKDAKDGDANLEHACD